MSIYQYTRVRTVKMLGGGRLEVDENTSHLGHYRVRRYDATGVKLEDAFTTTLPSILTAFTEA